MRRPPDRSCLFQDASFPASLVSVLGSRRLHPLESLCEGLSWKRPQDICSNPRLFPDTPQEGQVKQGILGDCWFLCACVILQRSEHLRAQEDSRNPCVSSHQEPVASCVPHRYDQEVTFQCTLGPGKYQVVPSTYHPNQEANFTLTLATKLERKPRQCRETLGQILQELSVSHVMKR